MKIILNNKEEIIDKDKISVSELLKLKKFTFRMLVTKVNGNLVKKDERENVVIEDGDDVTVLHLVSGG